MSEDINWQQTSGPGTNMQAAPQLPPTDVNVDFGEAEGFAPPVKAVDTGELDLTNVQTQPGQVMTEDGIIQLPQSLMTILPVGTILRYDKAVLSQDVMSLLNHDQIDKIMNHDYTIDIEHSTLPNGVNILFKYLNKPTPTSSYELEMWNKIEEFEQFAWSASNKGFNTGFESLNRAYDGGMKPGFVVVGGDSNLGKSGFISQLEWNIADLNDDAYVMSFSLDDPMSDKIPRVVGSFAKVPLNAIKSPNNYLDHPLMLARRRGGLTKLKNSVDSYQAYDANFSTFIEEIEEEIERKIIELEAEGSDKRVVVTIDNMHDLNSKDQTFANEKAKYDFIAQWCADLAIRHNILLIASAELKKINGVRRPALDDIREAVKIKYEAKAVMLVYQEVHYKAEGSQVFFNRQGYANKQPVFEVHMAKNKFASYKGRMFYEFYPEMARFEEPDVQTKQYYESLVYGA